jgi:CheY-like chemotaxis protein
MEARPTIASAQVTAKDRQVYALLRRPARVQKGRRSSSPSNGRRAFRILVVDDQRCVRNSLRSFLGHEPTWKVFEVESGQAALERFGEIRPEVVVLDIAMDGMSGLEASRRIRQIAPSTDVIFMSSYYTLLEPSALSDLFGGSAFVPKAEIGRLLRPTIEHLLGKRKLSA